MAHPNSKFKCFTLTLANSATLTGRCYIPPRTSPAARGRPLLVLLHGGGCHSGYYDVDKDHTASLTADALLLPVVSIDRPCYMGTSSLLPFPENSSFHKETGNWEHLYIFPAVWNAFGLPNDCCGIVAMAHSMATPGLLVAASLYAQSDNAAYPLAGLILSGWGCRPNSNSQLNWVTCSKEERQEKRHLIMLSDPRLHAADEGMRRCIAAQTVEAPSEEAKECVTGPWATYFPALAAQINIPIMFGVGEHDWLWEGTFDHVKEFSTFFRNCPRFDGSVVQGAPHAIEWSHYGAGWYARSFGFAIEVATYSAVHKWKSH